MDLFCPFPFQLLHIAFDRLKSHVPFPCPTSQTINIFLKFQLGKGKMWLGWGGYGWEVCVPIFHTWIPLPRVEKMVYSLGIQHIIWEGIPVVHNSVTEEIFPNIQPARFRL